MIQIQTIGIKNLKIYAYHGCYPQEKILGDWYQIDLIINTSIDFAAQTDSLEQTLNYETIVLICKRVMLTSYNLIETVAKKIVDEICNTFEKIQYIKIIISKCNVILENSTFTSFVEIEKKNENYFLIPK